MIHSKSLARGGTSEVGVRVETTDLSVTAFGGAELQRKVVSGSTGIVVGPDGAPAVQQPRQ